MCPGFWVHINAAGFFHAKNILQIGGELMKKFIAVALACAGAVLICATLKAAGKEA